MCPQFVNAGLLILGGLLLAKCEGWSGSPITKISNIEKMKINEKVDFHKVLSHLLLKGEPLISIKQKANNLSPFLLRGESISISKYQLGKDIVPTSCGGDNQPINISSIGLKPWPVFIPGQLTIGFDVTFNEPISETAQLTGDLELSWAAGSSWVKIPCIGQIGSCSYGDLCALTHQIASCPPEFQASGIPCKCPFNKGRYKLQDLTVEIDASVFLSGKYKAKVQLTEAPAKSLACYILEFTIG